MLGRVREEVCQREKKSRAGPKIQKRGCGGAGECGKDKIATRGGMGKWERVKTNANFTQEIRRGTENSTRIGRQSFRHLKDAKDREEGGSGKEREGQVTLVNSGNSAPKWFWNHRHLPKDKLLQWIRR